MNVETVPNASAGTDAVPGSATAREILHRSTEGGTRYRLATEIGRGATSIVFRGHDRLLGRDVALKAFTSRTPSTGEIDMQVAEAQLLAEMGHPAIVQLLDAVLDVRDEGGCTFMLVLELVDGPDLRSRLAAGALDPGCVAGIGQDLCGALVHAHARGVIHRDVKPANVLLTPAGAGGVRHAKLADFGIAVQPSGSWGDQVWTAGTAAYLSPEQVEGRRLSGATDVYSLGLVLLEALTARPTYGGSAVSAALARLHRDPDIPPGVDGALGDVLRAMTRRSPMDRPTASTALSAFRALAGRSGRSRALRLPVG